MSKSLTKPMLERGRRKSEPFAHSLIGCNVRYLGKVWRVHSAHRSDPDVEPWLTLRRGHAEVAAKPHEVEPVFD